MPVGSDHRHALPITYDSVREAQTIYNDLLRSPSLSIPQSIINLSHRVEIHGPPATELPSIPTPWREPEAITAVKALEATVALALMSIFHPAAPTASASIDLDHATLALFKSYLSTVDGHGKWDKRSLAFLKPTDIHQAQSNLYRRLSANMYRTADREKTFYHTHGSLDATPILNGLGLPGFLDQNDPRTDDYDALCELVSDKCRRFSADELDALTEKLRQAGGRCMTESDFLSTAHGLEIKNEPVIKVTRVNDDSPPAAAAVAAAAAARCTPGPNANKFVRAPSPYLLQNIKVLDLTRVIAGPSISRTLAEYGASVLKVTSPSLPDVPWYSVDLNFGKRTCELDLRNPSDRLRFEALLDEGDGVDVVVDGYRPGSLDRLGYGVDALAQRFRSRGKGFIYVQESCFGHVGPWSTRSGWQPIADAVSGLAWGHGRALGLDEPVLPPYPMSDYGTGALGAVGALLALYRRATQGGSWKVDVSLVKWNLWVQSLGQYPQEIWREMLRQHRAELAEFKIGHLSNFDVVSKAAIKSMRRLSPRLFDDDKYMFEMQCDGFKGAVVKSMKPVVQYEGMSTGFGAGQESRPNGYDTPSWTY